MRYLVLVLATLFCLGIAGCCEKKKEGEACKRHSECVDGLICSSIDQKCHTAESERKTRKAADKQAKKTRLKAAQKKAE